jgi:hypothetical protein
MRHTLAALLALIIGFSAAAVPRPKMDICQLKDLVPDADAFRATWTRENELVTPVQTVWMQASFSPAGRVVSPAAGTTAPLRSTAAALDRARERSLNNGLFTLKLLAARQLDDRLVAVRWTPGELFITVFADRGPLLSDVLVMSGDALKAAPESVAIEDAEGNQVVAWLRREPRSWTTNVHAAIVRKDGSVEAIAEPLIRDVKGIREIAIAWDGKRHLIAGVHDGGPQFDDTDIFIMRFDASLDRLDHAPVIVPGTRSAAAPLFLAANNGRFAIGWNRRSPHVVLVDSSGKISRPIDLHPGACRATSFR